MRQPIPVVVVALVPAVGAVQYFSDGAYSDVAAGIHPESRLSNQITFERAVSTVFWSGRSRAGIGAIELENSDGELDELLLAAHRGALVRIYVGTDETAWASMTLVAEAMVERPESIAESRIRFPVLDTSIELRQQLLNQTFSSGPLIRKPRPYLLGRCHSVPAQNSDFANSLWSVDDGDPWEIIDVRDSGFDLSQGGQWDTYNIGEHVGFELYQNHVGVITADAVGGFMAPIGGGLFVHTHSYNLEGMIYGIVLRIGLTPDDVANTVTSGLYYLGQEFSTDVSNPNTWGLFVDSNMTAEQAFDRISNSYGGWWYRDLDGLLQFDRLRPTTGTPVYDFTDTELRSEITMQFDTAPGLSTRLDCLPNFFIHSADDLAAAVLETSFAVTLQQEYRESLTVTVDPIYHNDAKNGDRPSRHSLASTVLTGTRVAEKYEELWDQPRWWYTCDVEMDVLEALTLMPGDLVSLTTDRYWLVEHLVRVIEIKGVIGDGQVKLKLWGGTPLAPAKE